MGGSVDASLGEVVAIKNQGSKGRYGILDDQNKLKYESDWRVQFQFLLLALTIPVKNRGKIRTKFILILNDNDGSLVWKRRTAWAVYIFRAGSCKI